jgi:hypothetical protein
LAIAPKLESDSPEGRYANYFKVGHNDLEFVLDFGQFYVAGRPKILARFITTPAHAKALHSLLGESIDKFEGSHGE